MSPLEQIQHAAKAAAIRTAPAQQQHHLQYTKLLVSMFHRASQALVFAVQTANWLERKCRMDCDIAPDEKEQ